MAKTINGTLGRDDLFGTARTDFIYGSWGADRMWGRGDSDVFVYKSVLDSLPSGPDKIKDFKSGIDHIDLRAIDANIHKPGNQAFNGSDRFKHAGDLIYKHGMVMGDIDGDRRPDFAIEVKYPGNDGDIFL